jgi:p-hydroxybenzoate 3-monooxygenase
VIAAAAPTSPRTIYALHRRGFAGQTRRSATATRYYVEVPGTDAIDDRPDDRVWDELQERPAAVDEQALAGVGWSD